MKQKKKATDEAAYCLTPKGLICGVMAADELVWVELQRYCERFKYNAILMNGKGGSFIRVEAENETNLK